MADAKLCDKPVHCLLNLNQRLNTIVISEQTIILTNSSWSTMHYI